MFSTFFIGRLISMTAAYSCVQRNINWAVFTKTEINYQLDNYNLTTIYYHIKAQRTIKNV